MDYAVEMLNITKKFPGVTANDNVTIQVRKGSVFCLVGENGAGKSTLMNILYGLFSPNSGEIKIGGVPVQFSSSADAISHKIGMVHQHFMLSPDLTILENIILGSEPIRKHKIDWKAAFDVLTVLMHEYGFSLPLLGKVGLLPMGQQQKIEIMKILYKGAGIIILDEPTAVLTPQETAEFFTNIRLLTENGKTVIFITHKLKEVMQVADEIVVMRQAKVVHQTLKENTEINQLAYHMVGEKLGNLISRKNVLHNPMLKIQHVSTLANNGETQLKDISLTVSYGEILGIAGVSGNGQKEFSEVLAGLRCIDTGEIEFKGRNITRVGRKARRNLGISYISEDRKEESLCLPWDVEMNSVAGYHDQKPCARGFMLWLNRAEFSKRANEYIKQFSIKTPSSKTAVEHLSGGNQQKIAVARETMLDQEFIIAAEPTRGIDIGAISLIHNHLMSLRNKGSAILLISSDLDEVFALSDKIAVMYEGTCVAVVDPKTTKRETIGLFMAGVSPEGQK
ncbi:MAG: ABC transporter ATP-binding protein [Bacteroidetes bacterium]|nr:ABC transporter ATP-binding protein [Bacteroidota bacterium]